MTIAINNPFDIRPGQDIKEIELVQNNVLIKTWRGDVWRVTIEWDGHPVIEYVQHG